MFKRIRMIAITLLIWTIKLMPNEAAVLESNNVGRRR
jgi:hypothetical protein